MPSRQYHVMAVARAFIVHPEDGRILLVQRAANDKNQPGLWEGPGGKLEKGETLLEAFSREIPQETGYTVRMRLDIAHTHSRIIPDGMHKGITCITVTYIVEIAGGVFELSHEHDDHRWVTYMELFNYKLTPAANAAAVALERHLHR